MSAIPRWATDRSDRPTHGPKVAEVASALGTPLLPWQRQVVDIALEHEGGRLVYRTVVVTVPRQNGKSALVAAVMLHRMLASRSHVAFAAQNRLAARQKLLEDHWPLIDRSRIGGQFKISGGTGMEALRSANGSTVRVVSSDESAGHGLTLNAALIDECWALGHEVEQALRPALATRENAQIWLVSTAGTSRSTWWRSQVQAGREAVEAGRSEGVAFFEWSALPGAELADPATWWGCMPALGHTITEATIAKDIAAMAPVEARRAYLNAWADEGDEVGWGLVDRELWEATAW